MRAHHEKLPGGQSSKESMTHPNIPEDLAHQALLKWSLEFEQLLVIFFQGSTLDMILFVCCCRYFYSILLY